MIETSKGKKEVHHEGIRVGAVDGTGTLEGDAAAAHELLESLVLVKHLSPWMTAFGHARSFANVAITLHRQIILSKMRDMTAVHPFVVNATFSIELFLKALAMKHGEKLWGHELLKLYEGLPQVAREEIQPHVLPCSIKRQLHAAPDLRMFLDELNNAFVQWRYSHESESACAINLERIIFLLDVFNEAGRTGVSNIKGA